MHSLETLKFPKKMSQNCPLCEMTHPIFVQGVVCNPERESEKLPVLDKGYSFCNCNNIFFTDWSNIDQSVYDENYRKKFDNESCYNAIARYAVYFPFIEKNANIKMFAEIGCINPALLDKAKERGWQTTAIDINPNIQFDNHDVIICDLEKQQLLEKYDVVWAAHIFEHFKDPLSVIKNLHKTINDEGILFVSMPDPYFIDWNHPHTWGHWHLREHHIMWDMDSFIEVVEKNNFKCILSKRNDVPKFNCFGDYHLIFKKI